PPHKHSPVTAEKPVWWQRDGKVVETEVTLVIKNSVYQQILSGIKRGDKIALQYEERKQGGNEKKTQENPFMPKPPGAKKK
ncbi:MAG: hypothetical protein K2M45_10310, partial [Muribaculaceae bacterium]|nr:hypothetical protein [Muribaculaceae bacterium]